MKYNIRYIFTILFLIFLIITFAYINSSPHSSEKTQESFISTFRTMYRPYVRNTRNLCEGLYNSYKSRIEVSLKKLGFI